MDINCFVLSIVDLIKFGVPWLFNTFFVCFTIFRAFDPTKGFQLDCAYGPENCVCPTNDTYMYCTLVQRTAVHIIVVIVSAVHLATDFSQP